MSHDSKPTFRDKHPLSVKQFKQIVCRKAQLQQTLHHLFAITWRPGDNTGNFLGDKFLRPIGSAVLCLLRYSSDEVGWQHLPFGGFQAAAQPDGSVNYSRSVFGYDGWYRPFRAARGRILDPYANSSLVETLLSLDHACVRRVSDSHHLSVVPKFPRIRLGFAVNEVPAFEETAALREDVAARLKIPVGRLGTKEPLLLDRMLHDVWDQMIVQPRTPTNPTDHVLVDAEFCSHARGALRVYEDFSELLGARKWNPVREVLSTTRPNPARTVLKAFGIDISQPDWREAIPSETMDKLEAGMRRALGPGDELFVREDIYAALDNLDSSVVASTTTTPFESLGEGKVVAAMRSLLSPRDVECCTYQDLLEAARRPKSPLVLSGGCREQVLYKQNLPDDAAFCFTPQVLGRKITADLYRSSERERVSSQPEVVHAETAVATG